MIKLKAQKILKYNGKLAISLIIKLSKNIGLEKLLEN